MRRYTFTILLALLAAILGAAVVAHSGGKYRASIFGVDATPAGKQLFTLEELNQVRKIELSQKDGSKVVMDYDGKDWHASEPWDDRADLRYVNYLFQFTTKLTVVDSLPRKGLELEKFGLRDGSTRVRMLNAQGDEIADFRIGRLSARHVASNDGKVLRPTIFIRHANRKLKDHVYLCTSEDNATKNIHTLFTHQFARFRDHHPLLFSPVQLDLISLKNAKGEIVISRDAKNPNWRITKPIQLRTDPKAMLSLMNTLSNLTAAKVEERAQVTLPTAGEGSSAAQEVSLRRVGSDETITLQIHPPVKDGDTTTLATVSNRPGSVFHLPLSNPAGADSTGVVTLDQLQIGVDDLRSKTMAYMRTRELKTISIRPTGLPETVLTRTPTTTWRVLRKDGLEATNENAIIRLLTAVTRDHVTRFVTDAATDLRPYGLQNPSIRLAFVSFRGETTRIAIGRGVDRKIYAHEIGQPNIWEISSETLGKIAVRSWQWRTGFVWAVHRVDVKKIKVMNRGQRPCELTYAHFSEKWTATRDGQSATADLNPHRANHFLNTLTGVSATAWLGPNHPQAVELLKKPRIHIEVQIQGVDDDGNDLPPVTKVLKIASTPSRLIHFAKVDTIPASAAEEGEESCFLVSPETVRLLSLDLFEH